MNIIHCVVMPCRMERFIMIATVSCLEYAANVENIRPSMQKIDIKEHLIRRMRMDKIIQCCGKEVKWTFVWEDRDGTWEEQTCSECGYKFSIRNKGYNGGEMNKKVALVILMFIISWLLIVVGQIWWKAI